MYGNDTNGDLFQAEAQNNELDLSDALRVERPTATYVYLNDVDGRRINCSHGAVNVSVSMSMV